MLLPILLLCLAGVGFLYLDHVNRGMKAVPQDVRRLSPRRWTVGDIHAAYESAVTSPVDVNQSLPPKQNRRYVVIGGSGMYPRIPRARSGGKAIDEFWQGWWATGW